MVSIDDRIDEHGLVLQPPVVVPADVVLAFEFVRVHGDRAYEAGHGPQGQDGKIQGPFGLVGDSVTEAEATAAARRTAPSMLGSLQRARGTLDRITAWLRVFGMVASNDGFERHPAVINGFSEVLVEVFGPDRGAHARSAVGVRSLPFSMPVEVEATVAISP